MYPAQDGLVVIIIAQPAMHKLSNFMAFIKFPDACPGDKYKLLLFVCCSAGAACFDGYFFMRHYDTC